MRSRDQAQAVSGASLPDHTPWVHIHAPQATMRSITSGECLDCGKYSRFAGLMTPWYGWRTTCLRCGRVWCEGEWMPLEFERGSRAKSIAGAKRAYREAMAYSTPLGATTASPAERSVPAQDEP